MPLIARSRRLPIVLALLFGLASLGLASDLRAAETITDDGGRSLSVSRADGLDPDGEVVTVEGSGYAEEKGIYVAFCVVNGPGQMPEPCGGGIDMSGDAGTSAWISSNPPPYGRDLARAYEPGGSFSAEIRVSAVIGEHDCRVEACAIVTRNDHTRTDDRSQDLAVPISFAAFDPLVVGGAVAAGAVVVAVPVAIVLRRRRSDA